MTTRIYYLIITNKSEMLVTGTSPNFRIPHEDAAVTFAEEKKLDSRDRRFIKKSFRDYVDVEISDKINIGKAISVCLSDPAGNVVALVHAIDEKDKGKYAVNGHSFVKTFDIPDKKTGVKVPVKLEPESVKLFTTGGYETRDSKLDKCIKSAFKKLIKSEEKSDGIDLGDSKKDDKKEETVKIYRFYRPGLFVPPFIVDPVASLFAMQRYGIRSPYNSPYNSPLSSPYSSPYSSPLSSRLRPEMPSRRYSPGDAPRVARSPRMGRLEGGYYEKYMKYKTKYLELKAQFI